MHILAHHIDATVEAKMKQFSPKCFQSLWE